MAKRKHHTLVSTPLAGRIFEKAAALHGEKNPEGRAALKNLKASHNKRYEKKVTMNQVAGFWNPDGKKQARGNNVKCNKINSVRRAKG